MANYNETAVSGSEYTRCKQITILNPLNETPTVQFDEERVTVLSNRVLIDNTGVVIDTMFDAAKSIDVLNPLTGEPTGTTATWGDIYALIYSAYIAEATARDNHGQ